MQTPNAGGGATEACAAEILDVVPAVMRFIRTEMRSHRAPGLSIPQFRTLMYVRRNRQVSLTGVAEHLGLTPASTSTLVDGLSRRGLLLRVASESDRRRVCLSLTASGQTAMESIRRETRATLARSALLGGRFGAAGHWQGDDGAAPDIRGKGMNR